MWWPYVDVEQSLNLLLREVQGSLVVCSAGIDYHSVQGACFGHNLVNGLRYALLLGDVGLNGEQSPGEAFGHRMELLTGLS
jgi:hypothetical protein